MLGMFGVICPAIRPARALGFAGIWLAVWSDGKWAVSEIMEG
jgi:hypothetical protein